MMPTELLSQYQHGSDGVLEGLRGASGLLDVSGRRVLLQRLLHRDGGGSLRDDRRAERGVSLLPGARSVRWRHRARLLRQRWHEAARRSVSVGRRVCLRRRERPADVSDGARVAGRVLQ